MSLKLWHNLYQLKHKARPSKEFRAALRYKLLERFEALHPAPVRANLWLRPVMRYAAVPICLVLILGLSTGVYAYNSPEVNESHPLYGLKKGIEKIEGRLARAPEKKAAFNLKQMQRRAAEIERLQAEKLPFEATLKDLNQAEENGLASADNVTSLQVRGIFIQKITEQGLAHLNRLEKVKNSLPLSAQPKMDLIIQKQTERFEQRLEERREKQAKFMENQADIFEKMQEEMEQQEEKIDQLREHQINNKPFPNGSLKEDKDRGRSGEKKANSQ